MTTLSKGTLVLKGRPLGMPSAYPALKDSVTPSYGADLGESEGLFVGCGMLPDPLPYAFLSDYDGEPGQVGLTSYTLENAYLKAVFLPELGGRLWQLFDKERQRDLVLANSELKFGNLGIANAWCAGGIEWNFGRRGHDPRTSLPRFAAVVEGAAPDGSDVLRIYEFMRDRAIPFQIDFFLPENSRYLYSRVRIFNPHRTMKWMYAWTNIAVAEEPGQRIVIPARSSYVNRYRNGSHFLSKVPLPEGDGSFDVTRPENFPYATDHFFNLEAGARRFEAAIGADGYGLMECSTARLQGRKLFVWGSSQGGRHWQRKLLGDDTPDYIEIQAGLAKTQMECLPMPPQTAWEYLQAFGAIQLSPDAVQHDWADAVAAVQTSLDQSLPAEELETLLQTTRSSIALRPGTILMSGSGWGALEEKRLGAKLLPALDFGVCGEEQAFWSDLLDGRGMPRRPSGSWFAVQAEYLPLLRKAAAGARSVFTDYALALFAYREQKFAEIPKLLNPWEDSELASHVLHLEAHAFRCLGDAVGAVGCAVRALALNPGDASLAKDLLRLIDAAGDCAAGLKAEAGLRAEVRGKELIRFLRADMLARTGKEAEAWAMLKDLDPTDIREGENSLSELYGYLHHGDYSRLPFTLDLRMSAPSAE